MAERGGEPRPVTRTIAPGSGTPFTASGRSIGYRPPPWRMRGRALALQFRLADPDEARRHVPPWVEMDADPIVRARFWDLEHDAAGPALDDDRPADAVWTPIREAVVAFPVRYGAVTGDLPTYMYADDPIYIAMGRELMGWPVRGATIEIEGAPGSVAEPGTPAAGTAIRARMLRGGREVMAATLTLSGAVARDHRPPPPRWLAEKVIGRVDGPGCGGRSAGRDRSGVDRAARSLGRDRDPRVRCGTRRRAHGAGSAGDRVGGALVGPGPRDRLG